MSGPPNARRAGPGTGSALAKDHPATSDGNFYSTDEATLERAIRHLERRHCLRAVIAGIVAAEIGIGGAAMSAVILGVDPGITGALCRLTDGIPTIFDMPTLRPGKRRVIDEIELARLIDASGHIDRAFVELVASRPGEGSVQSFSFGLGCGVLRGILRAHFIPITFVIPTKWKRAVGIPVGAGKDASRALAKEAFQHHAGLFARVKDEGRAEAALIALYGARTLTEQVSA